MTFDDPDVTVFATCPPWDGAAGDDYLRRLVEVGRWSEAAGCRGSLVYTDNAQLDPWTVAGLLVEHTSTLEPLVAVQPIYMHPYTAAKLIASLGQLHARRCHLNFVAGGFTNDLKALNDPTPHDRRYDRLVEYAEIIRRLTDGDGPVTYAGDFYATTALALRPMLPPHLRPGFFLSGSSPAGRAAAQRLGATPVTYPAPAAEMPDAAMQGIRGAVRLGIITRADEAAAWEEAADRFPPDRRGRLAHELARRVSDSHWHHNLSTSDEQDQNTPYWLEPFRQSQTMCPYLVGSHERVAMELARYLKDGCQAFILDVPASPEDLEDIATAFAAARHLCDTPSCTS